MSSIEEDIKRCEQLTKPEHANWIGISNQLAISHILAELEQKDKQIKDLEEENYAQKTVIFEKCIPIQVIIDKIEENSNIVKEIEEKIKEEENSGDICREYIRDLKRQKGLVKRDILTLQEFLEGEK